MRKMCKECLLFVTVLFLLCGCGESNNEGKNESGSTQTGVESFSMENEEVKDAITFETKDMKGNTVSSAIFLESKLTMLNVWATYCNPCLSEMPELGELAGEYDSKDFQIIGVISDVQEGANQEGMDYASDLIEQTGANYTHLLANDSMYEALLENVSAVPTTFFIDESGVIRDTVVGALEKSAWEEKINERLEEK